MTTKWKRTPVFFFSLEVSAQPDDLTIKPFFNVEKRYLHQPTNPNIHSEMGV